MSTLFYSKINKLTLEEGTIPPTLQ